MTGRDPNQSFTDLPATTPAPPRIDYRSLPRSAAEARFKWGSEQAGLHISEVTAQWLNVAIVLAANDTVELQRNFTGDDGYFAANHTRFWGFKLP